jgi:hypothetical protein
MGVVKEHHWDLLREKAAAKINSQSQTVVEELRAWRARQAQEFLRLGSRPDGESFVVPRQTASRYSREA